MKKIIFTFLFAAASLLFYAVFPASALAAVTHPAGTLVESGGTVWQINETGDGRLLIESPEKFFSNRLSFNYVVPASASDLALPQTGTLPWGDGVLFLDHGVIYQVSQGTKHGFTSGAAFLGQGFSFGMAKTGNLSALPEGQPISLAGAGHLPGTFVRTPAGAVFLLTFSGSMAFPSAAVFFSQGGKFSDAVLTNSADIISGAALAPYRTGTIVNDNGAIWVTKQTTKLGFPSADCFLNFGFNFSLAFTGSTADLSQAGTICGDPVGIIPVPVSPTGVSSYSSSIVSSSVGNFTVQAETFDLASGKIRVITDTAADRDCAADCPAAPLDAFLTANGGQAGTNGSYFCPPDYPPCAGKINTFNAKVIDTGIATQINANNNFGEDFPFITFDANGQAKYYNQWIDYKNSGTAAAAGIGYYGLVGGGAVTLNTNLLDDKQKTSKGTQGAIGLKGSTLYLVHVLGATVPEEAAVLQSMGLDNALLLDGGGSTAMIYNGVYKAGPGRNLPNAIVVKILP
ncbi:MAG: phosphodiester glycosidase family protein [Candidatus Doudnabacteria bacterium]